MNASSLVRFPLTLSHPLSPVVWQHAERAALFHIFEFDRENNDNWAHSNCIRYVFDRMGQVAK